MLEAAKRNKRLLAIGYQDYYQPLYWAAYHNIMMPGLLGDVYSVEAAWHNYSSGRLEGDPGAATFDPRPWGYASADELLNWRLFRRYSDGKQPVGSILIRMAGMSTTMFMQHLNIRMAEQQRFL
jgi:hypothetical protein